MKTQKPTIQHTLDVEVNEDSALYFLFEGATKEERNKILHKTIDDGISADYNEHYLEQRHRAEINSFIDELIQQLNGSKI